MGPEGEYLCAYHSILAHGYAVKAIRAQYPDRKLKFALPVVMGMFLLKDLMPQGWAEPLDPGKPEDVSAAARTLEYSGGWYTDPLYFGDYPESMRSDPVLAPNLKLFSAEEKSVIIGTADFVAINYYTSSYAYFDGGNGVKGQFGFTTVKNGQAIGSPAGIEWYAFFKLTKRQLVVPWGLRKLLGWMSARYKNADIWLTEIGCAGPSEDTKTRDEVIDDSFRIEFMKTHLASLMEAIQLDNIPVKTVLVWSFLDNWEWQFGFKPRFGVVGVDYTNGTLDRFVKNSGKFLADYFTGSAYWNEPNTPLKPSGGTGPTSNSSTVPGSRSKNAGLQTTAHSVLLVLCALLAAVVALF